MTSISTADFKKSIARPCGIINKLQIHRNGEVVIAQLQVLSRNFPLGTREKHEKVPSVDMLMGVEKETYRPHLHLN
jgi:hypothetical protein